MKIDCLSQHHKCKAMCCRVSVFQFVYPVRADIKAFAVAHLTPDMIHLYRLRGFGVLDVPGKDFHTVIVAGKIKKVIKSLDKWNLIIRHPCEALKDMKCTLFGKPERPKFCSDQDFETVKSGKYASTPHCIFKDATPEDRFVDVKL